MSAPTRAPAAANTRPPIRARQDAGLAARVARSAATAAGPAADLDEILGWLESRRRAVPFAVDRIPFADLDGWSFAPDTGNLVHRSGKFFTVEGLRAAVDDRQWCQPIICQPEVGILGVLAKEFDGVLHFLLQAKMEPGNPNLLQLSPTVQATRSNYTKVHRGASVRYLDHFTAPAEGSVLSDVLQSEHGSWFYRKRNRNMIVEVTDDVPPHEDFRWLTLGQIAELLRHDLVVNMDARSVLAGVPVQVAPRAVHSDIELLSWLVEQRAAVQASAERSPLAEVPGWLRAPHSIDHVDHRYFRIVAVSVRASSREVAAWTQPLLEPRGQGLVAFLSRDFGGVPHVLVSARAEGGLLDTAELGPTVQCTPDNYAHLPAGQRPPFLDAVRTADPSRIRYSALHSEEGGRFLDSVSRYLVVEAEDGQEPPGFRWMSHGQLAALAQHSHYVNVQARTLLTCLHATPSGEGPDGGPNGWAAVR
ncbi:NDP-hexose 2,3-dehydratase family protein [Streptomyces sp. B15]|uniref:NDP-hexose 2,3-dehydratase family protein n=1 Tax=Streptomyces sp. B15 TaxID=1537797 RepID=UPI0027DD013E|nr:NDP-hexose 2,3-dehydratase family protein [Streptomyces sp. B15]